jgi:alkaline phosphatase D
MTLHRRDLLQRTAGLAVALAGCVCLPRRAWSQGRFGTDPFALGIASGSPTHDSVVLWTRLVGAQHPLEAGDMVVRWELAHDVHFQRVAASGQSIAVAALAHAVHAEVHGLESDRWYYFRFLAGDAVSATGLTRTFPAPGAPANRLRLGYASCQHWEHGYYSAYRHMRTEVLDAVMFLGDYIYEYGGSSPAVRRVNSGPCVTLDAYRARYAHYKGDPDLQRMHAACPWLVVWDDHELQNDYAGSAPGFPGGEGVDFAARRAAAYQAYYEHMPLRASVLTRALAGLASGAELRIYGSVPYGNLARFYLLDDRQYRDPQACTKGGAPGSSMVNPQDCALWNDPRRTLLGMQQEHWLEQTFMGSTSQWNVLGQQTVFGRRDLRTGPGQALSNDGWDGYGAARSRLTNAFQRHAVRNPVILGGDVHANWVGYVKADYARPESAKLGVEFCGTSITSRGGTNERLAEVLAKNPHFVFADRERRGYGVVEFTPNQLTTTLRAVTDVTQADSGIETLATFTVPHGRPVLERA